MVILLASVFVALSISFLCSLMEATLLSLTPSQVAEFSARRPKLGALWQSFKANIERPISVILVLNTAAHTFGATIAGAEFEKLFGGDWIWLFSLAFTVLMLQFTEILPKTLGVRFNLQLSRVIARPLQLGIVILKPVLHALNWINRPFEPEPDKSAAGQTVGEIAALAGLARISKQISAYQERIIRAASRLGQLLVQDVMIPVEQISFLSTSQPLSEAIAAAHLEAHTRYPMCEDNDPNRVAGYVNFKEMIYYMRTNPKAPNLQGVIRPVHFVNPYESAATLLKLFIEQHIHMAIVRDENQRTLGMITFEDIVEEMVGDLEDEFDRLPRMFHELQGGTWMVGGGMLVADLARRLGMALSDAEGTISAWLSRRLQGMPRAGQTHREAGMEFTIRRVRRGKIFEVAVTRS